MVKNRSGGNLTHLYTQVQTRSFELHPFLWYGSCRGSWCSSLAIIYWFILAEEELVALYFNCGSLVVKHLPLVLEVTGSIPAHGKKNFGVQT